MRELLYAVRRLRSSPIFTMAAILTMAVAIGATASVYGVVDGVLLKQLPFRDPDRVLHVSESDQVAHLPDFSAAPANYLDWRAQNHVFSALAAQNQTMVTVTGAAEPERVLQDEVTPNYFAVLGMTPVLGRSLSDASTGPAEAVISNAYWQRHFGGAPSALGRAITIAGKPFTIVGVVGKGWPGPEQLWTRLSLAGQETNRGSHSLDVYGRLKPGVTADAARRDLQTIAQRLAQAFPNTNAGWSVLMVPVLDTVFGDVRPALVLLLAAAACVLLIGSANLANLFLVRCLAREREMAVRTALGATRRRLAGELLLEAMSLSLVAGALGVALAAGGVRVLRALAPPDLPRLAEVDVDGRLVAFCALATITTVVLFGVLPAWRASHGRLADMLKEGGRGTGSAQHHRLQDGLTALQIAIAFVLLTGASLLVESFEHYRRMDPGFRPDGVLSAEIALPAARYATRDQTSAFASRAVDLLAAQPGVRSASASSFVPGAEFGVVAFTVIGDPPPGPNQMPKASESAVSASYFETMGYRLLRGRGVLVTDDSRSVKVVVIDDLFARRFLAGRDPLGRQITFCCPRHPDTLQIVGVVAPVKEEGLLGVEQPHTYLSLAQRRFPEQVFFVEARTAGEPGTEAGGLRHTIATIDPTVPVSDIETMSSRMAAQLATTQFSAFLASLFAGLAVVLAALGIYSVLAYIVGQRRREIAVRVALGASRSRLVASVVGHALALTGLGIACGAVAAWAADRALSSLLVGVSSYAGTTFLGAAAGFAIVALSAASVPAFRTTRVDPVAILNST